MPFDAEDRPPSRSGHVSRNMTSFGGHLRTGSWCRLPAWSPTPSTGMLEGEEMGRRRIGMDVHREFAQLGVWEQGKVR